MIDRVHRGAPVTPHDDALHEMVQEVRAIYDLTDEQELRLLETCGNFINIIAVNALAGRPRVADKVQAGAPQGVQDGPEFMRPEEVAVATGLPVSTLAGMRRVGRGPTFRKEGRSVLYRRADVRTWIAEHVPVVSATPARDSLGVVPGPGQGNGSEDPSEMRS